MGRAFPADPKTASDLRLLPILCRFAPRDQAGRPSYFRATGWS